MRILIIAAASLTLAACSEKEQQTKIDYIKALDVAAMCQDIHVKQPFEYKGRLQIADVNSKRRPAQFKLTTGYVKREIEPGEMGKEAVARAQNPRLYSPPYSVSFWIENDDILNAKPPFLMSGKAGGEKEPEVIVDCNVVVLGEAPLPAKGK